MANPNLPTVKSSKNGLLNLKGQVFGSLTVLKLMSYRHKQKRMWMCKCECGMELVVRHDYLLHTNSPKTHCGCKNRGLPTLYLREYHIWNSMIRRCTVPSVVGYKEYGGRGIRVCDRWMEAFANFLEDMGKRPSPKHSLDRIDPNGNYEKGNVRWATDKEQARNKRDSLRIPHPVTGDLVSPAEVAEHLGIRYQSLRARMIKEGTWPTNPTTNFNAEQTKTVPEAANTQKGK